MRKSLLLFIGLVLVSCNSKINQTDTTRIFTKELQELQAFFSIPGMSAVVLNGEDKVYEKFFGYADVENSIKVDSSTAFPIASITKLFSSTLIMKLVEDGILSLDDNMSQYIPESQLHNSVQVKHLLSHTSQGVVGKQFY